MTMSIYFGGENVGEVATNTGWGDVCRWTDGLDPENYEQIVQLCEWGWCQELEKLEEQVVSAMETDPPEKETVKSTLKNLLKMVRNRSESIASVMIGTGLEGED